MAISQIELQYKYSGKGPVDAKSLVKNYDALLLQETWLNTADKSAAYNGMIVAVWLDSDSAKNGVYYLFDATVTNILKLPDVTKPANWHKLAEISDIVNLQTLIAASATKAEVEAALAAKLDSIVIEDYYKKSETYAKTELDELLSNISSGAASTTASVLKQLEEHISNSTSKFNELAGWTADYDTNVRPAVVANSAALAVLNGDASVEGSVASIVANAITAIPRATSESLGLVKASQEVTVDADGTLGIGNVSTDKLVQGAATLVLHGGDADPSDD